MKKLKKIITAIYFIILLVGGFMAYFVSSFKDGIWKDGLGRVLYESPGLINFFHFQDKWPGLYWWLFDMIYFWGGISFIVFILWKEETENK